MQNERGDAKLWVNPDCGLKTRAEADTICLAKSSI
ncbi:MAG: hypothetical protein LBJ25_00190 [Candidatus Margulisbacteria bacterium]|nr:hypothetical protein [Candidatus Margulisiibacteriota bacterium]